MWNRLTLAAGLIASTLVSGCTAFGSEGGCTLIGCMNQLEATIRMPSGALPSGAYSVNVKSGDYEKTFSCNVGTETNPCPTAKVVSDEGLAFVDGALVLMITRAPSQVTIAASQDGALVKQWTFSPDYKLVHPNGVECAPTCTQGTADLVIGD